ncbi:ABC transporter substrate-binding protein [Paenibacillus sp. S150]|uniref:ABC transporter substrate-binding protein n=1 Tax=Paenibacillus sp. S150 TaxID=2749826 RepID=UPI001C56DC3D|nr:iron-siderophore ABC transporter substrate-binding protein [Paenibacillus sp. S150]MBW4080656.1 iron-siderophore ABC transporter substrate-binding protein [Paenibacillus sp. S150]
MHPKIKGPGVISLFACLIMLLGACSNPSNEGSGNSAGTALNQTQATSEPAADTSSVAKPAPITIQHLKGELTLEEVPERIVVLDVQYADELLALGKKPTGSVVAGTDNAVPEYLGNQMDNVTLIGTYEEPNVEAVVSLSPDLIIGTEFHDKIYEELQKIAPTLMLERNEDWKTVMLKIGQVLDQPEQAQQLIDDYNQKVSNLKEALADKMKGQTVALIRPRDGMIRLQNTAHRTSQILYEDLGLTPPPMAVNSSDTSSMISIEVLPELGADHIFLLQDETNKALTAEFQSTSVWKNLSAVKDNRVYEENTAQWIGYYGPIAINLIVDQIADALN